MTLILPPPSQLGLPAHFSQWYPHQQDVVQQAIAATTRFVGINAPTGAGKSVLAEVIAQFTGGRSCYLVMTKPLADQITDPLAGIPYRYDVRGRSNYDCRLLNEHGFFGFAGRCDKAEALCEQCSYKEQGCGYFDGIRRASTERHPITNYDFWLNINKYRDEGIGAFDLLICDEAHDIYKKLGAFMRIDLQPSIAERETRRAVPGAGQPIAKWREWAAAHYPDIALKLDVMQQAVKNGGAHPGRDLAELKRLAGDLQGMLLMNDDWVEERSRGRGAEGAELIGFEPVDVAPYSSRLWLSVPRIVLMSAMLRPKHFADLGVPAADVTMIEAPSSFEVRRRPVIHVKTAQQRETMSDVSRRFTVSRFDQIAEPRLGAKGLVHTVSFDRAQFVQLHSQHSGYMLLHDSKGTAKAVEQFIRAMEPPAIFVSPSVMTGYNFAGDAARWQVIWKIPFDPPSPLALARKRRDPDSGKFAAIVSFIQACGRIVRGTRDWGETFCLDDNLLWFYPEAVRKGWVPGWFMPAVQLNVLVIPPPLRFGP